MTGTVVIALPYFRKEAERIAAFLGADVALYTPDIFSGSFSNRKRIVALMGAFYLKHPARMMSL